MEIKNLFNYATKELSQDAFLRWLFENYKCDVEGVRKVCYKVLRTFGLEINEGDITDLKTYAQDYKIDVMVVLSIERAGKKELHIIAIEDKAFSGEHDQLEKYNDALKKLAEYGKYHGRILDSYNLHQFHKIFYKTDLRNPEELKKVEEFEWKPYYIDDIYNDIFAEFTSNGKAVPTGSEVLDYYIDRICYLYKNLSAVSNNLVVEWDRTNFRSYLINGIKPYAESVAKENKVLLEAKEWSWQGRYISLGLVHHFQITKNRFPCLEFSMEIIARDFDIPENGMFSINLRCARIGREKNDNTNKNVELLQEDADPARAGLKKIIKQCKSSELFEMFKLMNHKACIATASEKLSEKLSYSQDLTTVIDKYIKEAVDAFVEICTNTLLPLNL